MRKTLRGLICLFLGMVLLASQARAIPMEGLYDAVVPVADTSEAARGPAFSRALEQVFVRIAGSRDVLGREGVRALLQDAGQLVDAYQYQQLGGEGAENLRLAVSFGAVGVTRALADTGAPVWGANRPAILAWVAIQSRSGRELVTAADSGIWSAALQRQARAKGIPLVFPDYDSQDRAIVGLSEIWGMFMSPIEEASARYRSDLLAVVRISRAGDGASARWSIHGRDLDLSGQVEAGAPPELADALMTEWAAALADRYAMTALSDQETDVVDMVIRGVEDLQAYAAIRQSLANMEPVADAAPVRVDGGLLRMRITFKGELGLLEQYLALEQRLVPVTGRAVNGMGADMAYNPSMGTPLSEIVVLDPQAAPQPGGNGNLLAPIPIDRENMGLGEEEDFRSLYPVLRFEWTGQSTSGEAEGAPAGIDATGPDQGQGGTAR